MVKVADPTDPRRAGIDLPLDMASWFIVIRCFVGFGFRWLMVLWSGCSGVARSTGAYVFSVSPVLGTQKRTAFLTAPSRLRLGFADRSGMCQHWNHGATPLNTYQHEVLGQASPSTSCWAKLTASLRDDTLPCQNCHGRGDRLVR